MRGKRSFWNVKFMGHVAHANGIFLYPEINSLSLPLCIWKKEKLKGAAELPRSSCYSEDWQTAGCHSQTFWLRKSQCGLGALHIRPISQVMPTSTLLCPANTFWEMLYSEALRAKRKPLLSRMCRRQVEWYSLRFIPWLDTTWETGWEIQLIHASTLTWSSVSSKDYGNRWRPTRGESSKTISFGACYRKGGSHQPLCLVEIDKAVLSSHVSDRRSLAWKL